MSKICRSKIYCAIILLSLLFHYQNATAQCPVADFTVPPTACAGSPIPISNLSTNSVRYEWDFTPGFFRSTGTKISDTSATSIAPKDLNVYMQNDTAIVFITDGTGKILRAIYGNGLDQPMTSVDDLGTFGTLYQASDIELYQENNEWYGLIVDIGNYSLTRFHLGTSLLNTPDNIQLLFSSVNSNLTTPWSVKIDKDSSGNVFALAVDYTIGSYTIFNFGNSITNTPIAGSATAIPGLSTVLDGYIIKDCGHLYVYFAGFTSSYIVKADFGYNIVNAPTFTTIASNSSPSDIAIVRDSSGYKLLCTNWNSNDITKYDLGSTLAGNTSTIIGTETFGGINCKGIDVIRNGNSQYVFLANNGSSNIQVIKYSSPMNASTAFSTDQSPQNISFNSAGTYSITLNAFDAQGISSSITKQIDIIEAPTSNFFASNLCDGDTTYFIDSTVVNNGVISSWNWDFGDGNMSTIQNPAHHYDSVGTYTVTLITAAGSCTNTISKQIEIAPIPTAYFSTVESCSNTPITFTDSSAIASGAISNWLWDFGNGDTSSVQNPVYAYPTGGNYNVTLTIISDKNCQSSLSVPQTINFGPIAGFRGVNTCVGQITNFQNLTVANGSAITNYFWDFGDGQTDTAFSPSHTYPNVIGDYTASLVVTAANGCNDTISQSLHVSNIPVAAFNLASTVCQNNLVQLNDQSSVVSDTISQWFWDFGDGQLDSVQSPLHAYSNPGNYTITLIAYSPSNCPSAPVQQAVNVIASPVAGFSFTSTCLGNSTTFTNLSVPAPGSSIVSYNWHFTANDSSSFANTFFTFSNDSTYPVALTVTSAEGCFAYDTMDVTVHSNPIADFSTNAACSRQSVHFTNLSSCDSLSTISQSLWNFGDFAHPNTNTSTLTSPTYVYDTAAFFNASLITVTNFGCSDTVIKTIRVNQSATVQFSYSPTCFGDLMEFFNPGTGIDSLYLWNFGDGQTNSLKEPAHYYSQANNYQVTLSVTTTKGCVSSASKQVSVSPIPTAAFSTPAACLDAPYTLLDNSTVTTGSIVDYDWRIIEDSVTLSGSTINYTFSDTGIYHVRLKVTSDIGCTKSITKSVTVHSLPIANFSFDPQFGNPPLEVNFTDLSVNAASYSWNFGTDTTTSFDFSPTNVYQDTGLFTITHIVTSQFGCKDTAQKNIYVIKPILDIAVTGDSSYIDGDYFHVVCTISNLGTLEINDVLMEARLADGNSIREHLIRPIPNGPGGIQTYTFNAAFRISEGINYDYYCIRAIQPNGETDNVLSNNEKCYSFSQYLSILNPYPNPATDLVNFRLIYPSKSTVSIALFDQMGKKVADIADGKVSEGFADYQIDTQNLDSGIYTVRISYKEKNYYRQIVVTHTTK
jgi:PKD repeat protein